MRTATTHLSRLVFLRALGIVGVVAAILIARFAFDIFLPFITLALIITCFVMVNALTWWRLRRPWAVSDQEMAFHLTLDVIWISVLIFFSGGSTNPFVSLLLLPLILVATLLPPRYSLLMSALTILCYTMLLFWYHPLVSELGSTSSIEHSHGQDTPIEPSFRLHIVGMWFNFVVSAALISLVAVKMQETIRARDQLLAMAREETLRNERIIALGTMAAGAAHELGTPLSTIAVVTKELLNDQQNNPQLSEDLQIIRTQVEQCKHTLSDLLANAGTTRLNSATILPLDKHLLQIIDKWLLVRPSARIRTQFRGEGPAPDVMLDQTLDQALMNLFNNAADVSPQNIELDCTWSSIDATITIRDYGPGMSEEALRNAGKVFFTTKGSGQGLGIGMLLANATIERFGGHVRWYNHEKGGAITQVTLPLYNL